MIRWSGDQVIRWSGVQVIEWSGGQVINVMLLSDINFRAAFNYAKVFSGEEDLESKMNTEAPKIEAPSAKTISKSKVEQTLSFEEFRIFFFEGTEGGGGIADFFSQGSRETHGGPKL